MCIMCLVVALLGSMTLYARTVVVTNECGVSVVNVGFDSSCGTERLTHVEANNDELKAFLDSRIKEVENRFDDRTQIEQQLSAAIESANAFYSVRYNELKSANDRFSVYADKWMTIMGGIVGAASLIATVLSVVFGCVIPTIEIHKRTKQLDEIKKRIILVEKTANDEIREQCRWMLSLIIQEIDLAPKTTPEEREALIHSMSRFLLLYCRMLESCVRDGNAVALQNEIRHCRPFLTRWIGESNNGLRSVFDTTLVGIKDCVRPDRTAYIDLLGGDSEAFALIESLYVRMGIWN